MQHFFNENRKRVCLLRGGGRALSMRSPGLHRARGHHPLRRGRKRLQGAPSSLLQLQPVRILSHLQQGRVKYVALVNGKSYEGQEGG